MNDEGDEERERSEREERRGGVCMDVDVCVKDEGDVFLATGTKQRKQERNECCPSSQIYIRFWYTTGMWYAMRYTFYRFLCESPVISD